MMTPEEKEILLNIAEAVKKTVNVVDSTNKALMLLTLQVDELKERIEKLEKEKN